MADNGPLTDKNALVTSSSRNLGAQIVRSLAAEGATVVLNYHDSKEAALDIVEDLEGDHLALYGDTSTPDGVRALVGNALEARGRIDILVNNSGPFSMDPFAELEESEWDRIWDSNVKAAYLATQLVVPGMREAGWGRIVNISAGSAFLRNHSIYTLAKEAMITLTEELALELGPEINVNAIAPGQIAESADDIAEFDPTFVERAIGHTPTGRLVTRPEVAAIVVALCTPLFDGVTGVTIPVDGGFRLGRF
ncbi:MAG: SDR family NAD(P)-dependent oxidoreductase [Acidimicrobiia bacterium]